MASKRILIADDEQVLASSLQRVFAAHGFDTHVCSKGDQLIPMMTSVNPDLVLLDIYMGEVNGLKLLVQLREGGWRTPAIMMTARAEISLAVEAIKLGASDFVTKPFDLSHLKIVVEKALEHAKMQQRLDLLQQELEEQRFSNGIVGKSAALRKVMETAERFAAGDSTTVLIQGESGTGKELIARHVCQRSARAEKPFITINCGAIPKDLAESEFFGYERGAFTGATDRMKQGKFELADGGTIFLDEIAELSLDMQVKLLRVLEERKFYRLGGVKEITVDVRIIAASNRDLQKEVEAGRFREDLFYRLHVACVTVPALRQRKEDIGPISYAFVQEFSKRFNRSAPTLSEETVQFLQKIPWRGNVRELRNAIERAVLMCDGQAITLKDFSFLEARADTAGMLRPANGNSFQLEIPTNGVEMRIVLRELIVKTLAITSGNQLQAAKVLGITRSKLRYRMDQLGIKPEERTFKITL